jgi:hypothetical protein
MHGDQPIDTPTLLLCGGLRAAARRRRRQLMMMLLPAALLMLTIPAGMAVADSNSQSRGRRRLGTTGRQQQPPPADAVMMTGLGASSSSPLARPFARSPPMGYSVSLYLPTSILVAAHTSHTDTWRQVWKAFHFETNQQDVQAAADGKCPRRHSVHPALALPSSPPLLFSVRLLDSA